MRLLIIAQKVDKNDDVLGFFHRWIEEFAKKCESVIAVCLQKGEYELPQNAKVLSLGKELGRNKLEYIFNLHKYIWRERKNYDAVFIHMNPQYVLVSAPIFKLLNKKIYFWYAHGLVDLKLKLSEKLVDKIFTSSKSGCRLESDKVAVVGQGIDTNKFQIPNSKLQNTRYKIVYVGRIAPVKNLDILVEAVEILRKQNMDFSLEIAGQPILGRDGIYFEKLKNSIQEKKLEDIISFVGPKSYKDIQDFYQSGDLFVNLSQTGSLDKTVLEAMATGLPVLTSNEAYFNILEKKYLTKNDPKEIAEKISYFIKNGIKSAPELREIVIKSHGLSNLIDKILNLIK